MKRVLFLGSSEFAVPSLQRLQQSAAVSDLHLTCCPDRPYSSHQRSMFQRLRPTIPTKDAAEQCGITFSQIDAKTPFRLPSDWTPPGVNMEAFDTLVVVSFGHFLPASFIQRFSRGAMNLHPSLLPDYRGAAPIPRAVEAGEQTTGVSVINLDPSTIDAGSVLLQKEVPIPPTACYPEVHEMLAQVGAQLIEEAVTGFESLQGSPQGTSLKKAPKIDAQDGFVEWNTQVAVQAYNKWRAFQTLTHVYTHVGKHRVNLLELGQPIQDPLPDPLPPGTAMYDLQLNAVLIACSNGTYIPCTLFHVAGKPRPVSAAEFARGYMTDPAHPKSFQTILFA